MSSSASRTRRRVAGERSRTRPSEPERRTAPAVRPRETSPAPRHTPAVEPPAQGRPEQARAERGVTPATSAARPRRPRLSGPGLALAAALIVLGVVAGLSLAAPTAQATQTRAATSAARTGIEQMLSYNYKTIDAQAAQIEALLTGSFKQEFAQAMDQDIKPLAVKNKTVVQARVSDVGVMEEAEGRVKVLAFVNQATVGADQKQPALDQNRVIATLTRVGDRWLISEVQAF